MWDLDALYEQYREMMRDFTSGHGVPEDEGEILIEDSLLHLNSMPAIDIAIGDWLANDIARRARHYARYIAPLPLHERVVRTTLYRLPLRKFQQLQQSMVASPSAGSAVLIRDTLADRLKARPGDLLTITPREFEEVVAELFADMGARVQITPKTRDGGYDLAAYLPSAVGEFLCLVEVKRNRPDRPVSVGVVRALYGVVSDTDANAGMIVTTSYFSREAKVFQERHQRLLQLAEYEHVVKWLSEFPRRARAAT